MILSRGGALLAVVVIPTLLAGRGALGQVDRVTVNQRELRVEFPRDTARHWGWSNVTDRSDPQRYMWSMSVNSADGARTVSLDVMADEGQTRDFPSLQALVAAGRLWLCDTGLGGRCRSRSTASAIVERGQVVLQLRDSGAVAQLFELRPATVLLQQETPGVRPRPPAVTVAVTYSAPQIPEPNADRRWQASVRWTKYGPPTSAYRQVAGGPRRGDTLSLAIGDTATLNVLNADCHYDVCLIIDSSLSGDWTVDDSTIATIAATSADSARVTEGLHAPKGLVRARRAGYTTLRVTLPVPVLVNLRGADSTNTSIRVPVVVVP